MRMTAAAPSGSDRPARANAGASRAATPSGSGDRRPRADDGAPRPATTLVAGIGNEDRGDDAIGAQVVRTLMARWGGAHRSGADVRALRGDALALLDAFVGYERVVLIDATEPAGAPGTVRCLRSAYGLRAATAPSTHGLGVAEALALGEALGSLPQRILIVGVEAESFEHGAVASAAVRAGVEAAADAVETVLAEPS